MPLCLHFPLERERGGAKDYEAWSACGMQLAGGVNDGCTKPTKTPRMGNHFSFQRLALFGYKRYKQLRGYPRNANRNVKFTDASVINCLGWPIHHWGWGSSPSLGGIWNGSVWNPNGIRETVWLISLSQVKKFQWIKQSRRRLHIPMTIRSRLSLPSWGGQPSKNRICHTTTEGIQCQLCLITWMCSWAYSWDILPCGMRLSHWCAKITSASGRNSSPQNHSRLSLVRI